MATDPTAEFLAGLAKTDLLTPPQLADLGRWAAGAAADPTALAKELLRRGWLTAFQIKEVYKGRGAGLALGPYRLLDLLGEGGMGRVFKAHHTRLGRDVALKVIRKEKLANPLTVRRFHQEVQAVAHLSHPNVVLAFDADEADGTHYFAMEFIEGLDLTKLVKARGPLPVAEACDYVRQAALGLHHAFERGLVHRDVKPSNLLATRGGVVKVLDLGLALLNDPHGVDGTRATQDGFVIGTPDFLAPEQARNPQGVDTRADVYALGCTLYYLLTGKVPFDAPSPAEKLIRHCVDPPPDLRVERPDAPPQLAAIAQWLMAKHPNDRPPTPAHAAAALQPFCPMPATGTHPVPALTIPTFAPPPADEGQRSSQLFKIVRGPTAAQTRERAARRVSPAVVAVAVVAMVAVAVAGWVMFTAVTAAPPPPPEAFTVEKLGLKFLRLPGGTFNMGSPDSESGRGPDEGPVAAVTVTGPFYLSATEVTHAQFAQLFGRAPSASAARAAAKVGAELPVESVTWDEAVEFCKKLTEQDRARRAGWAYRLPTEAEWEYACRAGTTTPFAGGEKLVPGTDAVFRPAADDPYAEGDPGRPGLIPGRVGQTKANAFGLFDMHGNVAEWCQDGYARNYPAGPRTNPAGAGGDTRVARGGGFTDRGAKCRSAARRPLPPDTRDAAVGFRVAFAPAAGKE